MDNSNHCAIGERHTKRRRLSRGYELGSIESFRRHDEGSKMLPEKKLTNTFESNDELNLVKQSETRGEQKPDDELICFGTLCEITCQFTSAGGRKLVELLRKSLQQAEPESFHVRTNDGSCTIASCNSIILGYMNHKTSAALTSLADSHRLQFEAFLEASELHEKISLYERGTSKVLFNINVNIIGPEYVSEAIASEMASHQLYLQRPYYITGGLAYRNPQFLVIEGLSDDELIQYTSGDQEEHIPDQEDMHPANDAFEMLQSAMDTIPAHVGLPKIDIDSKVVTQLMSHQLDVVDFLVAREHGVHKTLSSLWEQDVAENGNKFFRHAITGIKSPCPNDTPGGILADDMGLGKTLSMIATIVTTLAEGRKYLSSGRAKDEAPRMIPTAATLVIVPSALLLDGWIEEIQKHVAPESIKFHKYHGLTRNIDLASLNSYDIVISTYGTVSTDHERQRGLLNNIHWYRIVLDEAHIIRNWSTKQFHAIHSLSSRNKWCMTGTPIQNSLEDLGALVQFIRLPILGEPANFRRYIVGGIKAPWQPTKPNFQNLKRLISAICLRRPNSLLPLPGISYQDYRPKFNKAERHYYNTLVQACYAAVERSIGAFKASNKKLGVLESLLQIRLFCNEGLEFGRDDSRSCESNEQILSILQQGDDANCAYCHYEVLSFGEKYSELSQETSAPLLTRCLRLVCGECTSRYLGEVSQSSRHGYVLCPFCGQIEKVDHNPTVDSNSAPGFPTRWYSSKLLALVNNILEHHASEKCLVFSFWKRTLDLVEELLAQKNIQYARLDGSVSQARRKQALQIFRNDDSIRVLLMTFGCGSTGLNNLSIATRVHIIEPQWNPSVESQAIGRIFRHGQAKMVTVVRYICQDSIEEAVETRQLRKLEMSCGGGLDASRNDQRETSKDRITRTSLALREYLVKYMMSNEFKDTTDTAS